ncbi:MAG: hypothetical protein GX944_02330 [Alphaproteobacteria bacterium]|nr:hypothetical protein [Alphaproteobacteria bacterium]
MKKLYFIFSVFFVTVFFTPVSYGALVEIKKASPAVEQKQKGIGGLMAGNSLVPTALGLVGNVMTLNKQQAALTAECVPTDSEIAFVKMLVQEWAKAGGEITINNRKACDSGNDYQSSLRFSDDNPCYNSFNKSTDEYQIYKDYPYPGKGYILKDYSLEESDKNKIIKSDIYEIFLKIGFDDADLLPNEVPMVAKLKEKAAKCAPEKLSAKQRELWGNMLMETVGGLGKKQNAGNIMEQVGSVLQSGGSSPLGTLGGTVNVLTGTLLGGQ